jgi:hypothetical protein
MSFSLRAIWKNSSTAIILLGLCSTALFADESSLHTGGASWREKIGLSGSFRLGEYYRDRSFSADKGYLNGSVWGSFKPQEIAGFKPSIDLRAQGQNLTRSSSIDVNLREAFVEKSVGPFDFRVGRQIIIWGRADKVNPTDNLTSRDFSLLVTDDEDQRSGPFAAQAVYNLDSWRLTGIWQPEWRSPVFPLGAPPPGVSFSYGVPQNSHEQFGLKLDNSGGAIDWSFSFFHGVDRTPDIKVLSSGAAGTSLELNFQKIDVLGADFATNLGSYGVRGEASYTRTQDSQGTDPLTKNSNLFVVLGADRSFYETLNINAQYLYRHVFDYFDGTISDPNVSTLALQVNINSAQLSRNMHGASLRISHKALNETLESELTGVGWFTTQDYLIRPKITYAFSDTFRGTLGIEIFQGNASTFFGRLRSLSSGFAEIRLLF